MSILEEHLQTLYRILEDEIGAYTVLKKEVEGESECLRRGSPEELMGVIQRIENQRGAILQVREKLNRMVEAIGLTLGGTERELSALLPGLPISAQARIRRYCDELGGIQEWMRRRNERNKGFIRECQACCREFVSILLQPLAAAPGYDRHGWTNPAHPPCALNRKV